MFWFLFLLPYEIHTSVRGGGCSRTPRVIYACDLIQSVLSGRMLDVMSTETAVRQRQREEAAYRSGIFESCSCVQVLLKSATIILLCNTQLLLKIAASTCMIMNHYSLDQKWHQYFCFYFFSQ